MVKNGLAENYQPVKGGVKLSPDCQSDVNTYGSKKSGVGQSNLSIHWGQSDSGTGISYVKSDLHFTS